MVHGGDGGDERRRRAAAAVAAYLGVKKQRAKASSLAMRRLQNSWLANQDSAVLQALAWNAANEGEQRRVVPRALGKWRGSTIAGYLTHDDTTYVQNFRATRLQLDGIVGLLQGSALDFLQAQRQEVRVSTATPRRGVLTSKQRKTVRARQSLDPPTLRFKVALCMYALGQGGPVKVLADAGSVGSSSLRRYLELFADAVIARMKPIYMPGQPYSPSELSAVQDQFASRRGIHNVTLACDGSHVPFRPKNKKIFLDYRNYKGWTSILLVAFVDSYYRFFEVDVGYPGRAGDNTVLSRNAFMHALCADPEKWLGNGGVVLGDSGASDGDKVFLNPYHAPTDEDKCWFNFCHSSTRFFVEQVFGLWKSRFRFLLYSMPGANHKLFSKIVYASTVLHNYLVANRTGNDVSIDVSAPCWHHFFETYKAHLCPTCKHEGRAHCVHQAQYRIGSAQIANVRKAPSAMRDELCAKLWMEVCNDPAIRHNMTARATQAASFD